MKKVTKCRVCGCSDFTKYLDLGMMPLSNNLQSTPEDANKADRYPLELMICNYCSLSQLTNIIDANILFQHYVYRSGIARGWAKHCCDMAFYFQEKFNLNENSFMIDIAGNDGTLLDQFQQVIGLKSLNVDPADGLSELNEQKGVRYFKSFWGMQAANHLMNTGWPKADLITATNVFAHVDDLNDFLQACRCTLSPKGILVMEFPYLVDFLDGVEFDTIYFEHVSYFSLFPLNIICSINNMKVVDAERIQIHGGSLRVYIRSIENNNNKMKPRDADERMYKLFYDEIHNGYQDINTYREWAKKVYRRIQDFRTTVLSLPEGNRVAAFAASAKGNVLLNACGLTFNHISFIVDQTPEKLGKYSPGTGIPIVGINVFKSIPVDYLIVLSWNFADEIITKCRSAGYKGKFIIPDKKIQII